MQRGLGRGFQGEGAVGELDSPTQDPRADAGSAHSPLAFPHELLHQEQLTFVLCVVFVLFINT